MPHHTASCHCGKVKFSFDCPPITKGLRCNCSICARKGAMMSPEPIAPELFRIEAEEGALGLYQFGAGRRSTTSAGTAASTPSTKPHARSATSAPI